MARAHIPGLPQQVKAWKLEEKFNKKSENWEKNFKLFQNSNKFC